MASSSATGTARTLSESRAEALQALLNSLTPRAETSDGFQLQPDQVRRMSDKLGELLGEDALPGMGQRNEKGELLNDDGLPIVDIVEPVPEGPSLGARPPNFEDANLIPLWALSHAEKARRRAERDRILDALEEEERTQQAKEEAQERQHIKMELEKRKQTASADVDALKKARELQKKMGKALLRNITEARDREEQEKRELEEVENRAREERKKLKPRKSVSFADLPPDHEHQPANCSWTDIAPTTPPKTLPTKGETNRGPMRMDVVERIPGLLRVPKSPPPLKQVDSDDESDPGSPAPTESDTDDSSPPRADDTDESDYGMPQDVEPVDWDDEGFDFAQHQREIALAYYEKRATVGAQALAAMRNHEHTAEENEWDQPDVPLHATLSSPAPKPPISRFKASLSNTSSLPSQSLGASILPASQTSALKSAVRLGKLDKGELLGGEDGESDDEMDPTSKELLEILKKGDAVNVGPTLPSDSTGTDHTDILQRSKIIVDTTTPSLTSCTPVPIPSKVSRFKVAMTHPTPPSSLISPGSTPTSTVDRSSPKLPSRTGTPISVSTNAPQPQPGPSRTPSERRTMPMPGMIVDSPSFPVPGVARSPLLLGPSDITAFQSMIIESPSFHSPSSTVVGTPNGTSPSPSPAVTMPSGLIAPMSALVLERKPIATSEVREATTIPRPRDGVKGTKMSRFLAERT